MKKAKEKEMAVETARQQLEKLLTERDLAIEEEKHNREEKETEIHKLIDDTYFCGVILSTNDVLQIVKLAIDKNEQIQIPFKLYNLE